MKRIFSLLLAVLLVVALPLRVHAQETIDPDKNGSITVKMKDGNTALTGLKLTCIRVGTLEAANGKYEYLRAYDKKVLTETLYTQSLAGELMTFVKDNSSNYTFQQLEERVDKEGYATFSNCKSGLYLICQEEDFTLNGKKYGTIHPFLVTVPYNGSYDVKPTAKPGLDVLKKDSRPSEKLPQTGQLNWPVPILAASGLALVTLGLVLCSGRKREAYET